MPKRLPQERRNQILKRARLCIAADIGYSLGGGSSDPRSPSPADETDNCDCSAFVCWVLGLKKLSPFLWLRHVNGGWLNTNGIYWDARFEPTGVFEWVRHGTQGTNGVEWKDEIWPSDVIVYPGSSTHFPKPIGKIPKIGHVGIVSEVTENEPTQIIHCSAGNERKLGYAIAETPPVAFLAQPSTIVARCMLLP